MEEQQHTPGSAGLMAAAQKGGGFVSHNPKAVLETPGACLITLQGTACHVPLLLQVYYGNKVLFIHQRTYCKLYSAFYEFRKEVEFCHQIWRSVLPEEKKV